MLAAYVSGHGFGHSTRVGEVLRALRRLRPDLPIAVVTSAPERLYRESVPGPFAFRPVECDVGLAQRGSLVIDEETTLSRWREFAAGQAARAAREAAWMRDSALLGGSRKGFAKLPDGFRMGNRQALDLA